MISQTNKIFDITKIFKPYPPKVCKPPHSKHLSTKKIPSQKQKSRIRCGGPFKIGRWNFLEHDSFVNACFQHGNNWKKIQEVVKTRSRAQIRSHAQKYLNKLCRKYGIKLVPKNVRKRVRLVAENCEEILGVNASLNMDTKEKKILEVFNSKSEMRAQRACSRESGALKSNPRIGFIKRQNKSKKKEIKVFKISKKERDAEPSACSLILYEFLRQTKRLNNYILDENCMPPFSYSSSLDTILLNPMNDTRPIAIERDNGLNKFTQQGYLYFSRFVNGISKLQSDLLEEVRKISVQTMTETQIESSEEKNKNQTSSRVSDISTKYELLV